MKHKVGDVVQIKSLDWYNKNKYEQIASLAGEKSPLFASVMTEYCGMQAKISSISGHMYKLDIDCGLWDWADYMFEEGCVIDHKKEDMVNHPSHYTWLKEKCGIEVIDITRHLDFDLGNSVKYILRSNHKHDASMSDKEKAIQDLEKAIFYLKDEINMIKNSK